jgi:signal transduction histidine kinase
MPDVTENRTELRKKTAIHAFASDTHNKYEIKCIIREMSQSGCRIVSNVLDDLPEIINLLPEGFDRPVLGRIVWRDKSIAGVQFLTRAEGEGLLVNPVTGQNWHGPSSIVEGLAAEQLQPKRNFRDRFRIFSQERVKSVQNPPASDKESRENPVAGYLSMLVHEFRTPLTSLLGSLGLIRNGLGGVMPEKFTALFNVAERNAEKLKFMVNDLLDIGKAESGKVVLENRPVDVIALARDSISVNEPYAKKYGVFFRLDDRLGQAHIHADPARLEQVLTNLLSNAAKFSPQGKAIDVIVERNDERIRFSVRDRGPGIPPEQQTQIFDKYVQVQGKGGRPKHGTGLGLAVCKSIVEQHGSSLKLRSEPGAGSTFFFELPELETKSATNCTGISA